MLRLFILFFVLCGMAYAGTGLFNVDVTNTTKGTSYSNSFDNVSDALDSMDTDAIKKEISYDNSDIISSVVDFRGLPVNLDYGTGTTLTFNIPSLGITETFTGHTRDESVDKMTDWLENNGGDVVERMMRKLAEVSPVDPIAGNPSSIMSTSVASDFGTGFTDVATKQSTQQVVGAAIDNTVRENAIMIAPTYSSLDTDGKKSESYTLPLAYAFSIGDDSREKLVVSLPITYTQIEGAESFSLGLAFAYSKPITQDWVLTPAISYGASGSIDLGAFAQVASASLTSMYSWDLPSDYTLSMGNMIGYYSTVKFYESDYAYDPGIANTVYRNALMLNIPTDSVIEGTSLETFVIDTRYTGTALYMEEYQEYGFSYGYDRVNVNLLTDDERYAVRRSFKVGFSYLDSKKSNGFKVNFGFVF